MRNAFASEITNAASEDARVVLLSGDIGNRLFDDFKRRCPDRFFNCGVAEANMIGVAAGMALSGLRPVAYTITPFITTRCLEQIRVDVCYHHVPVIIVGVGAGLSYATLGATHHSCEDIAFLRALPHMTVVCPADAFEVRRALRASLAHNGPVYIRLGKKGEPLVHAQAPEFMLGRGITVRKGRDVCVLATGNIVPTVISAAEMLADRDIRAEVVSLHTVKPLDGPLLTNVFDRFPLIVSVEEHSLIGGLGSAVAEWCVDRGGVGARLLRIGTPDTFLHEAGEQEYARERFGLTPALISAQIEQALQRRNLQAATVDGCTTRELQR